MHWTPPYPDYPTARFLRVLFSVALSLYVSLMISMSLWGHVDGHYMHRAAVPLFTIAFLFPLFIGFIVVATGILYWLDRVAFRSSPLSKIQSSVLVLILAAGVLTGYYVEILGAVSLFLLLYWCMTGRVAGRQGWSLRDFSHTKWDEKIYAVLSIVLSTGFLTSVLVSVATAVFYSFLPVSPAAEPLPYPVQFEHQRHHGVKRSVRRFPDAQSCLESDASSDKHEDLFRMDWHQIITTSDAEVCSFRLLHALGDISHATRWLEAQGFTVGESFSSASPYVGRDGTLRVDGGWSIRKRGPRFPTSGIIRRIFKAVPYGMGVRATYSPDGQELLYLNIDSSTL
ncbi:MAG: hypothetical protein AAF678_02765 [Pseudomonadota bacterium]